MDDTKDGWPELTYKYVEFYFWEPQHLLKTLSSVEEAKKKGLKKVEVVREKVRTHEVPLNFLLNILLRVLPAQLRRDALGAFGIDTSEASLGALDLKTPQNYRYIQPDVHLESDRARVFVELKVDAALAATQVKKYLRLHSDLDRREGRKRSYLLFMVKTPQLVVSGLKQKFSHVGAHAGLQAESQLQAPGVTYGSTTWGTFGTALRQRALVGHDGAAAEMLNVLVGDFVEDLRQRGLAF